MKQIVDKLNKIAKKIDENVEIPQTDLIIDSLDAITKAYGGTPNDSNLIVDKLEDIYNNIGSGGGGGGGEETITFTLIPEDDYTTELDQGDNIILELMALGNFNGIFGRSSITLNINGTDVIFTPTTDGSPTYTHEGGYELSTTDNGYLILPESGTYHIKSSITLTGPTIPVNEEIGSIRAVVDNIEYVYYMTLGGLVLNEIIADSITPMSSGQ